MPIFMFILTHCLHLYHHLHLDLVCLNPVYTDIALVTMALYRIWCKFIALGSCEPDAVAPCAAADVVLGQHLL